MKMMIGLLVFLVHFSYAQNRYASPDKTDKFSQDDWLEIMSDIANDPTVLLQMKNYQGKPISLAHKPYVCFVDSSRRIVLQFCPECKWVVGNTFQEGSLEKICITSDKNYDFHMKNVLCGNIWKPGDIVCAMLYLVCRPPHFDAATPECFLIPVPSPLPIGAYTIFPDKKRRVIK